MSGKTCNGESAVIRVTMLTKSVGKNDRVASPHYAEFCKFRMLILVINTFQSVVVDLIKLKKAFPDVKLFLFLLSSY